MSTVTALIKESERLRYQGWQRLGRAMELIRRADALLDEASVGSTYTIHRCVICGLEYPLFAEERAWLEERGWVRKRCHDCLVHTREFRAARAKRQQQSRATEPSHGSSAEASGAAAGDMSGAGPAGEQVNDTHTTQAADEAAEEQSHADNRHES